MVYESRVQRTDPFPTPSVVPAVNLNTPLSQVAKALSIIEPNLQKVIVNKIKEIKADETQEGLQEGKKAGTNYMAQSELLYPKETELDQTSNTIANKLAALTKAGNEQESRMLRANNPWFKHAFYSAKSKTLATGLTKEWKEDIKKVQMVDPQDGKLKSMAAFGFNSPQVQGYVGAKRNARVEQLDMPEYYVKKYFLPAIETGIGEFQTEHTKLRTDLKLDNFEKLNRIGLETIISEYLVQAEGKGKDYVKGELKTWVDELRKFYVGQDFTKEMGVHTDYLMDRAIAIASKKDAGDVRFDDARNFIEDFSSLFPKYSLGTKKVLQPDGSYKEVPTVNPKNSLTNSKKYLDKLNTTLKTIDTLESRHFDFKDKIQPKIDIARAEEIIREDDGTLPEEKRIANQKELDNLIATDKKVASWVKDNQYVLSDNNIERQIYYQSKVTFGEIRDKKLGFAIINDIWNKSLKTPADLEFRTNMIDSLREDVKNANQVAIKAAGDTVSQLNKIYQNKKNITPNMQDQIEDIQFGIPMKYLNYWKTPSIDTGKVDKDNQPILRTPNLDEFKDFVATVQEQSINNIRAIRDVTSDEGNKNIPQNRTIKQFNDDLLEDNRVRARSLIMTAQTLRVEAPFIDGVQERPTLADVAEQFSFGDSITPDGIIASFNDAEGNFDTTQKESIRQFFKFVRVTDNEIKAYALVEKGALSNERLKAYRETTNVGKGGVIIEGQGQAGEGQGGVIIEGQEGEGGEGEGGIVGGGSENVDNSDVSGETQGKRTSGSGEERNVNDFNEIIDPANLKKVDASGTLGNIANNVINALTGTQSVEASEMNPNLGLRDGSLLAMNLPAKGKETNEQQDKKVEISKDPNNIVRMETNFKTIYALAKEVGIKFPEVVAAQFGVESTHGLKVTGINNYLGIKARPEDIESGNFTEVDTFEEIDGKMVKVKAKFKNFKSIKESLLDYKKHHNDDWFNGFTTRKGTINVDTAEEAIIRLKENKYATDSAYVKLVTDVLNDARREPALF